MSTPQARLAELGLVLPPVAAPLAAYVPAVRTGNLVYTASDLISGFFHQIFIIRVNQVYHY